MLYSDGRDGTEVFSMYFSAITIATTLHCPVTVTHDSLLFSFFNLCSFRLSETATTVTVRASETETVRMGGGCMEAYIRCLKGHCF